MSEPEATELPPPEGVDPRPTGWWGSLLAIAVLATAYAAMYFSYVYIRVGNEHWPPGDLDPPALGLPALAALVLLASAVVMDKASRQGSAGSVAGLRLGLFGALAAGAGHVGLLIADWQRAEFDVGLNAYASLYYVLPAIHLSALTVALVWAGLLLALTFAYELTPDHHAGHRALSLYWYFVAGGGVLLLATVYLIPHVWPVAPGAG